MAQDDQSEADVVCRMEEFTKSISLKIIGFSLINRTTPKMDWVVGNFNLGGHSWAITFSPYHRGLTLCPTLHVSLLTETKTEMALQVEYSLFDHKSGIYSVEGLANTRNWGKVSKQGDSTMRDYFKDTSTFRLKYLKDGCFMLKCSVKLVKSLWVESKKKRVIVPSSDLQHSSKFSYSMEHADVVYSMEHADVVFRVGEDTFSAHRNVLAACSPVFKAEFYGPMLESTTKCVKIKDIKPEVFKLMLHFVYTDTITLNEDVSFEMSQHLLAAADRYGLERLKLICEEKLSDSIDVENATDILVFSDKHNCDQLKEICLDFVASEKNLQAVMATDGFKHLMETSPFILRDILETVDCKRKCN